MHSSILPLFLILTAWAVYFFLHSLLAGKGIKSWVASHFPGGVRFYRLGYNLLSTVGLGALLWFHFRTDSPALFESGMLNLVAGGSLIVAGTIMLGMVFRNYGLGEFSGIQQLKGRGVPEHSELSKNGINGLVRHPIYLALLAIVLGVFLQLPNLLNLLLFVEVFVYILIGIRLEEKKLIEAFGEAYEEYRKEVKMLIPFVF